GKKHSIIVLAEGVMSGAELSNKLKEQFGLESRYTTLGHVQRGGSPSAMDRVLASRLGNYAVDLLMEGISGKAVGIRDNKLVTTDFEDIFNATEHEIDLNLCEVSKQLGI
ncbi:6-phosphofructokinase, partial [Streptococcus danieliae]|nr:6-phosphofructokinase [Streptococcus danieliae]